MGGVVQPGGPLLEPSQKPERKEPPARPKQPKVYGQMRRNRRMRAASRTRDKMVVALAMASVLLPILAMAALTADQPITVFDGISRASLHPSNWMTWSDFWFAASLFAMILMTRRYGAAAIVQAHAFAWILLLIASFGMIIFLAPQLTSGDLPQGSYILGVTVSWYAAPVISIHFYDVMRGGRWWKAPLLAGLLGMVIQTALFFPIAYPNTTVPWVLWWGTDLVLKIFAVVIFVGGYAFIRRQVKPLPNLGGR